MGNSMKPVCRQDPMRNWEISSGGQKLYHNLEARPQWAGQLRDPGTSLSAELLRNPSNRLRPLPGRLRSSCNLDVVMDVRHTAGE